MGRFAPELTGLRGRESQRQAAPILQVDESTDGIGTSDTEIIATRHQFKDDQQANGQQKRRTVAPFAPGIDTPRKDNAFEGRLANVRSASSKPGSKMFKPTNTLSRLQPGAGTISKRKLGPTELAVGSDKRQKIDETYISKSTENRQSSGLASSPRSTERTQKIDPLGYAPRPASFLSKNSNSFESLTTSAYSSTPSMMMNKPPSAKRRKAAQTEAKGRLVIKLDEGFGDITEDTVVTKKLKFSGSCQERLRQKHEGNKADGSDDELAGAPTPMNRRVPWLPKSKDSLTKELCITIQAFASPGYTARSDDLMLIWDNESRRFELWQGKSRPIVARVAHTITLSADNISSFCISSGPDVLVQIVTKGPSNDHTYILFGNHDDAQICCRRLSIKSQRLQDFNRARAAFKESFIAPDTVRGRLSKLQQEKRQNNIAEPSEKEKMVPAPSEPDARHDPCNGENTVATRRRDRMQAESSTEDTLQKTRGQKDALPEAIAGQSLHSIKRAAREAQQLDEYRIAKDGSSVRSSNEEHPTDVAATSGTTRTSTKQQRENSWEPEATRGSRQTASQAIDKQAAGEHPTDGAATSGTTRTLTKRSRENSWEPGPTRARRQTVTQTIDKQSAGLMKRKRTGLSAEQQSKDHDVVPSTTSKDDHKDTMLRRSQRASRDRPARERSPPPAAKWSRANHPKPWSQPVIYPLEGTRRVTVEFQDLERLDEGEFLNDTLISFALRRIEDSVPEEFSKHIHFFNSYFYSALCSNKGMRGFNYDAVKRWTKNTDLLKFDFVVVPINHDFHWFAAIICNLPSLDPEAPASSPMLLDAVDDTEQKLEDMSLQDQQISVEVPDSQEAAVPEAKQSPRKSTKKRRAPSLPKRGPSEPLIVTLDSFGTVHTTEISVLKDYVREEVYNKRQVTIERTDFKGLTARGLAEQNNFCDCGLFVIAYMEAFARNPRRFINKLLDKSMRPQVDFEGFDPSKKRAEIRDDLLSLYSQQEQQRAEKKHKKAAAKSNSIALEKKSDVAQGLEVGPSSPDEVASS